MIDKLIDIYYIIIVDIFLYMKTLVCCICKLENNYIREYVEWYKNLGFTNICLYDNNDIDGELLSEPIKDYIDSGFVILKDVRGKKGIKEYRKGYKSCQLDCYNDCYKTISMDYDWTLFVDADEYLMIKNGDNISDFLQRPEYKGFDIIRFCWKYYDDNNIVSVRNNNYSISRFSKPSLKAGQCVWTKSIIRSGLDIVLDTPHGLSKEQNPSPIKACDVLGRNQRHGEVLNNFEIVHNIAWINHYRFKTIEEYLTKKMIRKWPDSHEDDGEHLDIKMFFMWNQATEEKINKIKEILNIK